MTRKEQIKKALHHKRQSVKRFYQYARMIVEQETISDLKQSLNFTKEFVFQYKTLTRRTNINQRINFKTWLFYYGFPETNVYTRKFSLKSINQNRFFKTCENYCASIDLKLKNK